MTAQRRVVAEVLDGEHVHLTADEVHARAVAKLPEISRATVYNTLGELVTLGEVLEVSTDRRAKRYDPNAHRPTTTWSAPGAARSVTSTRRATHSPTSPTPSASASRCRT